jgi:hypothetical protein
MMIWLLVLLVIGFAKAHEISTTRAAIAVFLPVVVCMALCLGFAAFDLMSTLALSPPPP